MFRMGAMAARAAIALSTAVAHAQLGSTQSLGEVARQTVAKRAARKPATKVYTNANLAPTVVEVTPAAGTSAAATDAAYVSKTSGEPESADRVIANSQEKLKRDTASMDEKYWRNEASHLRNELRRARADTEMFKNPPEDEGMRRLVAKKYENALRMVAFFEEKWESLEQAAHSANVPLAWLEPKP